ncbi:monovalent cation/H+ antiporter complex subunit F [Ilumatobacter coccineus]|uniref:Na(+)/H(+) antiporter subunit F n=1 Tax=Ilumatobacter coccineus (strain NBRC 103263 / KCTC 29153 / YM16-304) TaxID=1313172 RepID=A0A6C7ECA6_ILUCY|nr:monovalent cation/H+ antiporter complex subunit F [Ilumatobacter coccineus]BAN04111.1 Na(+)/H(+) antiporter subunit F [Ilumatobacter coccineus YM16-304]
MIGLAEPVLIVSMIGLAFAGGAAVWRVLTGPSLADRILGLDLALIALMAGIAIDGAHRGDTTWLNLLVVIAVIGFTATVASTRFMETTRDGDDDREAT